MPERPALARLPDAVGLAAAVGVTGYLAKVFGRGLDTTDEGFYLLAARHPEEVVFSLSSFHDYWGFLFRALGYDVVRFRWLGLMVLVAAAVVLAVGVARLVARLDDTEPDYAAYVGLTALGTLLYYGWYLPTPSYNLLNSALASSALGLLLAALAALDGVSGRRPLGGALPRVAGAGLLLGVAAFVKGTSAVPLLLGFGVLCSGWPTLAARQRMRLSAALGAGFLVWPALHFLAIEPWAVWWGSTRASYTAALLLDPGRDLATTLVRYRVDLVELLGNVWGRSWALFLALILAAWWLRRARSLVAAAAAAALGVAAWLGWSAGQHVAGVDRLHHVTRFHLGVLGLLSLVALAMRAAVPVRSRFAGVGKRRALLAATLLLMPLAMSFGTNNNIASFSAQFLGPWFALYAWLCGAIGAIGPSASGRWTAAAAKALVVAFTGSQIVMGSWTRPYRLNGTLGDQTVRTAVGHPSTALALDPPTSAFIEGVRARLVANGYRPGDDLLGLYGVQGIVYAVGGRTVGMPWLSGDYPGSRRYAERALARVPSDRLRRAFLLLTTDSADRLPRLAELGLDFPDGYERCGALEIPYPSAEGMLEIWRPLPGPAAR